MRSVDDRTVDSLLKSEEMIDMLVTCGVTTKVRYSLRDRHDIVVALAVHDLVLKVNAELHQFMEGLELYGILDFFKSNYEAGRSLMCSGNVFMPTPDDFIDDMNEPEYSVEGGNRHKLEVDVFAYFIQFLEDFSDEGTCGLKTSFLVTYYISFPLLFQKKRGAFLKKEALSLCPDNVVYKPKIATTMDNHKTGQ